MQFLGMAGYYRHFCCNFLMITAPLTKLLKKNQKYKWSSSCQAAFQQEKLMFSSRPILMTSDFQKPFLLMVDASTSNIGAGAILMQSDDKDIEHTICCFSCKFDSHQNYSPIEKEALVLLLALQHFNVYLCTTLFLVTVFTDHNPVVFVNKMKNKNQWLLRWSLCYQEYIFNIQHIWG